jgi:DNA mismatch endonuclease, patch repair protein
MRLVKSKDTGAELKIRRLLHGKGYRYRLYRKDLPGKPDIVFPRRRCIIFVHGCFWHGHSCARGDRIPKTNTDYWRDKIERNRERDRITIQALAETQWKVLVVWECEIKDERQLESRLVTFLE